MMQVNPEIVKDISLLYELSLSVGKSLDLEENCKYFLSTLMRRKNLAYVSVWIHERFLKYHQNEGKVFERVYAQPKFRTTNLEIEEGHPLLKRLEKEEAFIVSEKQPQEGLEIPDEAKETGAYAIFRLGEIGFLKLFSFREKDSFGDLWMQKLSNVILQFATSLKGCLAFRQVNWEIQERKITEEKLIASKQMEEQFFANMSHEIRTPLNGILGMMNLMLNTPLRDDQREYVQDMKVSSHTLLAILNDILDYSRIKQGKIEIEHIKFDLIRNLKSLYHTAKARGREKGLKVSLTVDIDLPQFLMGDPVRINQILENLISNALKFTHQGGVNIQARVIEQVDQDILVVFEVEDTGIGISKENQKSIFEHFFQATSDTTRKYGGTGLGLAIVRQLLDLMGGTLQLESEIDRGTKFECILPMEVPDQEPDPSSIREFEPENKKDLNGYHILVAEDTLMNQKVLQRMLGKWGSTVSIANDGIEALEMCRLENYDLILMDLHMPNMDGYEATVMIRENLEPNAAKVPILALTASASENVKKKVLETGMDAYLVKPFEPDQLYSLIKFFIQKRKPIVLNTETETGTGKHFVDLTFLLDLADGDGHFVMDMLKIFIDQVPIELETIQRNIEKENWPQLRQQVHKLKYPFSSVGRNDLRKVLQKMELLAREGEEIKEFENQFLILRRETDLILFHLEKKDF